MPESPGTDFMNNSNAPTPIREADYEAIEAALLQSARGRWFLAEYSKRNRGADTRMLLDAISRLEATILQPRKKTEDSGIRRDLIEMSEAISQTRREIAAMRFSDHDDSQFTNATEELDSIVEATEKATSDILQAAEDIQEVAWLLREKGVEEASCDQLDSRATDIYTACSFQDLTGQRTGKVVEVLRFLENRVKAMIDIWGLDDLEVRDRETGEARPDAHLLNGPPRNGEGVDQDEVDQMLGGGGGDDAAAFAPADTAPSAVAQPRGQTPGEVEAGAFEAPAGLEVGELDETKTEALFS